MILLLQASFVVVFPSADLSAAAGNPFLGRYQSGRDDDSPMATRRNTSTLNGTFTGDRRFTSSISFPQTLEGERILREPATANGPTVPPRQYFRHCS